MYNTRGLYVETSFGQPFGLDFVNPLLIVRSGFWHIPCYMHICIRAPFWVGNDRV